MTVLEQARGWLEAMKAHTDCCGTPVVRKLVAELEKANQQRQEMAYAIRAIAPAELPVRKLVSFETAQFIYP
jgi:hypothetical protein